MPHGYRYRSSTDFLFPYAQSTVLPDPSRFLFPHLLASPLPTNSSFQNFVLNNGDQLEYVHPYLIKCFNSSLSMCFPSRIVTSSFIFQAFNADLTFSSPSNPSQNHIISSFDDLSVTLYLPPALRFFLVRGSPFVTCSTLDGPAPISISTIHAFLSIDSNPSSTKHTFHLNSNQTFVCYSSSPLYLTQSNVSLLTAENFSGVIRIAFLLPDPTYESVLDRFSACYPVSGEASFPRPFFLDYKWTKEGGGDLLLLAHPLHLRLLSPDDSSVTVLRDFKYRSIDGELVGVVGLENRHYLSYMAFHQGCECEPLSGDHLRSLQGRQCSGFHHHYFLVLLWESHRLGCPLGSDCRRGLFSGCHSGGAVLPEGLHHAVARWELRWEWFPL